MGAVACIQETPRVLMRNQECMLAIVLGFTYILLIFIFQIPWLTENSEKTGGCYLIKGDLEVCMYN
jgi:hypothetical protein